MKQTFSILLPALLLVACAADSDAPIGAEASELAFRAPTSSPDGGPASSRFSGPGNIVSPPMKMCWWHPEPQQECFVPAGREPTCPTCCQNCFRMDWGSKQYALLSAGPGLDVANLADHAVLSTSSNPGVAKDDHEFVDIQPAQVDGGYQAVEVPPAYMGASHVYVWFVHETDFGSSLYGATSLPKL